MYYPGWKVTIGEIAAALFRANYALRGVPAPPGIHRIRFAYRPWSFQFGAENSVVGCLLLLASCLMLRQGRRWRPDAAEGART